MTVAISYISLLDYLDAPLREQLARDGDIPPEQRALLASRLRSTLAAYAAYIPHRLVEKQRASPVPGRVSGDFWNGSLLFADLSGFTALSAELSNLGKQGAEEVSGVVNRLFNALVAEVLDHQGALLKFGGDALTAFFDAEALGGLHAVAATRAALAMQERMADFAALQTRRGKFRLQLRVGVHSGRVFAAEVGDESHIELVVTGSEVNRVATAQEIAAPGEVVISDYTAALLEGAVITPRKAGFQLITALPEIVLPPRPSDVIESSGPDDLATLDTLAAQIVALRPYLMRGLPSRFLDASVFEMGEFRPVTVIFVNFHDFSALLEVLADDAECAARILNAYYRRAQIIVHRYEGIVNKVDMYTHGDKLMVLFGAPTAHEDDPLRAVRCALDLKMTLQEANTEISAILAHCIQDSQSCDTAADEQIATWINQGLFNQRVGINTGTVFAGHVGGAKRYEYTVMGSAVNLSARLMSATPDETILLSPDTYASVERSIAVEKQPPLTLKGLPEPVEPFRALYALDVERMQSSRGDMGITRAPLVGRSGIIALLTKESVIALNGNGRVLAVVGDAGVGKSRMVEELTQNLIMWDGRDDGLIVPDFQLYTNDCQSYEQSQLYAAIRKPLYHFLRYSLPRDTTHVFDSGPGDKPINLLESTVGQLAPEMLRFTPLLGDVLGLNLPSTPLIDSLNPEQRHDRLQELIVELIEQSARREPLLLSFEDIQWADASSLELIERLSKIAVDIPLLILLNYRPDPPIPEPWTNLPITIRIALNELDHQESEQLLRSMLNGTPPPEIVPLLDRTQGNPFFIEELIRMLITSGALARDESGEWCMTCSLENMLLPTSIEGLIFSRLDRLEEKPHDLVQVASVIGRRFERQVLEAVYTDPPYVDTGLNCLIDVEIITSEQQETGLSYLFRHALLRDVAYEGILYARRRELHRRVATYLEYLSLGGERDSILSLLARHTLLAEEWMFAFYYNKEAGIHAQKRYANREALSLYDAALSVAPYLEQEPWRVEPQDSESQQGSFAVYCPVLPIDIQIAEVYERKGYIHALLGDGEQAEDAYLKALALMEQLRAKRDAFNFTGTLCDRFELDCANTSIRLYRHLATLNEQHGNYVRAFEFLQQGMALANAQTSSELTRCYLAGARIYYSQADFSHSLEWARMALTIAERLDNPVDQAQALLRIGVLWDEQGDFAQAIPAKEQACDLLKRSNTLIALNKALNDLGVTYDRVGRWQDAIECYGRSLQISENIGDVQIMARASNNLALVLVAQGELERASDLYDYSRTQFRRIGSEQGMALSMLNRGEVLLLQGCTQDAVDLLHESIDILERINARIDLPECLRLAAEAHLQLGEIDHAIADASRAKDIAHELGMAIDEAVAYRTLGLIALHTRDFDRSRDCLEQSRKALDELGERYELGKVLFYLARLFHAQGQRDLAQETVRQSKDIFRELDAQRDLEHVMAFASAIEE